MGQCFLLERGNLNQALDIARTVNLAVVQEYIEQAQSFIQAEQGGDLWELAREAPRLIARHYGEYIGQMIDEFQFINRFIYYESVWGYHSPPLHPYEFQIDVFAKAKSGDYSLIGEVKQRQRKFSLNSNKFTDTHPPALPPRLPAWTKQHGASQGLSAVDSRP